MRAANSGDPWARVQSGKAIEILGSCVGDRHNLIEGLTLADHAQIRARTLFGRIHTLLEVDNFSVQSTVALAQRIVEIALLSDRGAQLQRFSVTVVGKPEFGLKTEPGYTE